MDIFLSILLVLFFVLVNAFFSGTEMAVISLNDAKMHKLAEDGDKKALRVIKFLDNRLDGTGVRYHCKTVVGDILLRVSAVKECFFKSLLA